MLAADELLSFYVHFIVRAEPLALADHVAVAFDELPSPQDLVLFVDLLVLVCAGLVGEVARPFAHGRPLLDRRHVGGAVLLVVEPIVAVVFHVAAAIRAAAVVVVGLLVVVAPERHCWNCTCFCLLFVHACVCIYSQAWVCQALVGAFIPKRYIEHLMRRSFFCFFCFRQNKAS